MARVHYWYYLTNEEGQPVPDASISVYQAGGTTTAIKVYAGETESSVISTAPQVTTDSNGYFEFWVADASDLTNGYSNIKLRVAWTKPGAIDDGYVDNVEFSVFPHSYSVAIETGTWTALSGMYYIDIVHSLGNNYPLAILYDESTTLSLPITAGVINTVSTRIWCDTDQTGTVTLIG
jgi:hypothetical protein